MDPPRGWIATANYRPDWPEDGRPLSYSWCAPYRYLRISGALPGMRAPTPEDFRRLQMDVHSLQADKLLPRVLACAFSDARAVEAAGLLAAWNHEITAESAAAAVYEVFLTELERELLSDRLGRDLVLYLNARMYGIVDEIFERPDSPFWRRADGAGSDPTAIIETALARAVDVCARRMGRNRQAWAWGRLHRHTFRHPGASGPFTEMLLNPASAPAAGDSNTLNVSWSQPARGSYDVTLVPSMRMVTSLGNPDSLQIIGPLGQSGQPGHAHYDDLTELWRTGGMISIPLTRPAVDAIARETLVLQP
jgi:penicillin G amidase